MTDAEFEALFAPHKKLRINESPLRELWPKSMMARLHISNTERAFQDERIAGLHKDRFVAMFEFRSTYVSEDTRSDGNLFESYLHRVVSEVSRRDFDLLQKMRRPAWVYTNGDDAEGVAMHLADAPDSNGESFKMWLENRLSNTGVLTLEASKRLSGRQTESYKVTEVPAMRTTTLRPGGLQPTMATAAAPFMKLGKLCSPEYFREDSCLTALFLEQYRDTIMRKQPLTPATMLTHEGLYQLATGEELAAGAPAALTLTQFARICERFKVPVSVIDASAHVVYEYDPKVRKADKLAKMRLVFHDQHVWLANAAVHQFDQVRRWRKVEAPKEDIGLSLEISDKWTRSRPEAGALPAVVRTLDDLLALDLPTANAVCLGSVEALAIAAWEAGFEPGNPKMASGVIASCLLNLPTKCGGQHIVRLSATISHAILDTQEAVNDAATSSAQALFNERLGETLEVFQPINGMSRYSPSVRTGLTQFKRGARSGALVDEALNFELTEFDISRAYTEHLASISQIAVFSSFDELVPCEAFPATYDPNAFYAIDVQTLDPILFSSKIDFVTGHVMRFAQAEGIALPECIGVVHPSEVIDCDGAASLRALYETDELSDLHRKNIANITYGLCNKIHNRKERGTCFRDKDEALATSQTVIPIGPGYIAYKQAKCVLREGYLPIGRQVLDLARIKLYRMVRALGDMAVAVRTDAVYVRPEHTEIGREALRAAGFRFATECSGWDVVGSLKVGKKPSFLDGKVKYRDERDYFESQPDEDDRLEAFFGVKPLSAPPHLTMRDEYDAAEADELMLATGGLRILGRVPGAGKTYMVVESLKRRGLVSTSLVVCPYNKLNSDMTRRGLEAVTIHRLCGKRAVAEADADNAENKARPYDLKGKTHIHFEELYLATAREVEWVHAVMKANPHITYSMTGDFKQLEPVGQRLIDADAFYERAFSSMFPRTLMLSVPKRVTDTADRIRQRRMMDALMSDDADIDAVIADAGLTEMRFSDLHKKDSLHPHIVATRQARCLVNHWAHEQTVGAGSNDVYTVGQTLVGAETARGRGGMVYSNMEYTVCEVTDSDIVVQAPDRTTRTIKRECAGKRFARPYAMTCHAAQGMTLGKTVYIHVPRNCPMITARWFRTAASRGETMDIIIVRPDANEPAFSRKLAESRIAAHQRTDERAAFNWDASRYVTVDWVMARLRSQQYRCAHCGEAIGNLKWSIDRLHNTLPHTKSNCVLSCKRCNDASCHRH